MAHHNDLGTRGEDLAKAFLEGNNYQILETNWRCGRAEIDIIAMDGDCLVIIEVKTRSNEKKTKPQEAVGRKKQKLLAFAAGIYAEQMNHTWEVRFDVIAITMTNHQPIVKHYVDAFYPDWTW